MKAYKLSDTDSDDFETEEIDSDDSEIETKTIKRSQIMKI